MNDKKWDIYKCEKCGGLMELEIEKVVLICVMLLPWLFTY